MRLSIAIAALVALSSPVHAQASQTFWLLAKHDGKTWCGYADSVEFKSDVKVLNPEESARATYVLDTLTEVTYQLDAQSGDWVVVDKYTLSNGHLALRRANLLAQANREVIEQTSIRDGTAEAFQIVNTTTLDGKKADYSSSLDLPSVPVITNLLKTPFLTIVAEMRRRSDSKLCRSF